MAVLQQPVVSGNVFGDVIGDDLAPAGTYVATVIDIVDEFGVQRQKFQSLEMELVDQATFLFGFRDAQGGEHRVASRRMKISGNEKSTLFGFLKSLLGRAPQFGWDYIELKGAQCLLTVEHVQRRDGTGVFAAIAALSPVPAGFGQVQISGHAAVGNGHAARPVGAPATMAARSGPVAGVRPAGAAGAAGVAARGAAVTGPGVRVASDPIPF